MPSEQEILDRLLATVPANMDKRPGSIIYDALAPAASELSDLYDYLEIFMEESYLLTASGENLDNRAADFAIDRNPATYAERLATALNDDGELTTVPIGSQFAVPTEEDEEEVTFTVDREEGVGVYVLICDEPGTIGNIHYGFLVPLEEITDLATIEMTDMITPGQDEEEDDDFRERVLDKLRRKSFGGNIANYIELVMKIDGVGGVKVFPAWAGGGTVKLSVIDAGFDPISDSFKSTLKEIIDPTDLEGTGVGEAPIGHIVTIATPSKYEVSVTIQAELSGGVTAGQLKPAVMQTIEGIFLNLRKEWMDNEKTEIFPMRMALEILGSSEFIVNVNSVLLNGSSATISLEDTAQAQYLPYVGVVILNGV